MLVRCAGLIKSGLTITSLCVSFQSVMRRREFQKRSQRASIYRCTGQRKWGGGREEKKLFHFLRKKVIKRRICQVRTKRCRVVFRGGGPIDGVVNSTSSGRQNNENLKRHFADCLSRCLQSRHMPNKKTIAYVM